MMSFDNQFSLPENIKIIERCPLCNGSGKKLDAKILGETLDRQIVHFHCDACRGSIIALFMISNVGVTSYGLVTDLSFEDVRKFKKSKEIELDDVIHAHENLKLRHFLKKIQYS